MIAAADPLARFHAKVDRSGGPDACWPWRGRTDKDGYGKHSYCPTGRYPQRHVRAHRLALELATGSSGEVAMHSCDNPACCNPAHLRWGTALENRADCVQKDRQAQGDAHGARIKPERWKRGASHAMAKLSDADVEAIRAAYVPRRGVGALAARYGIDPGTVRAIGTGRYARVRSGPEVTP